jgi:hypothetical protein
VTSLNKRVVASYRAKLSAQAPGARQRAHKNTNPINKPKGIDRDIVKNFGLSKDEGEDVVEADRRDIRPQDVFNPTPDQTGVLSLAQSGKDLAKALEKQVPRDKGYDVVRNLSQYLIRTEGNGSDGTGEGRK